MGNDVVHIEAKLLTAKHIVMAATGEVLAGVADKRLRIYRASATPTSDLSGIATFNDGVTTYYGGYNWKTSAEYGFDENGTAYIELPIGLGLDITYTGSVNVAVNLLYEVVG